MNRQSDRDAIAEEAVGQRRGNAPPYAMTKPETSQDQAVQKLGLSSGDRATIPEKTAESIGERTGVAYADPQSSGQRRSGRPTGGRDSSPGSLPARQNAAVTVFEELYGGRFVTVVAGFALGYATAIWLDHRSNSRSKNTPGSFQITRPPRDDAHPRGFVEATVLKTIAEHPQGMTTAELITELGTQGIGQQSIADALGTLVQAKKVISEARSGKYRSAAPEVPTAPDQPSS